MSGPAKGTGLRQHRDLVKLVPGTPRNITRGEIHGGTKLHQSCIPELRKLLRTDLSITKIAEHFGVTHPTLNSFIRRRGICNVTDRARFIAYQKSVSRGAIE